MAKNKLVRIGEKPKLPTVAEFFVDMAAKQGEEIARLKQAALDLADSEQSPEPEPGGTVAPYPWQLHPLRKTATAKKSSAKKSAKASKKSSAKKGKPTGG